jgi:hypothetical protein
LLTRGEPPAEGRARTTRLSAEGHRRLRAATDDVDAVDQILRDSAPQTDHAVIHAWLATAAQRLEAGRQPQRQQRSR